MNNVELTIKENELYKLIGEHQNGLTLKEICDLLPQHFVYDTQAVNPCRTLYRSIEIINLSLEVDKSIVKNKNGRFKFATREETEKFIDDMLNKAMTYLKRRSIAIKKAKQNGQLDILHAKPKYHEAFASFMEEENINDFMTIPPFNSLTIEEVAQDNEIERLTSETTSDKGNTPETPKQRSNDLKTLKNYVLTSKGDIINSELATIKEVNGVFYVKYTAFRERSNGSYFAEDVKGVVVATSDSRVDLGGEEER